MKRAPFALLILALCLAAEGASAQARSCFTTADCSSTTVCVQSFWRIGPFVLGSGERLCKAQVCNDDGDCARFRFRSVCLQGLCQATGNDPARNPPRPTPGGRVGEGAACGRIKTGQVTKTIGCPKPLVCDKGASDRGVCKRPEA